ncbi:uncharacterized protein N7500_001612 [Penicillium coprophilum]|uniref:uncharacterized protein n=1 Tax=Penicillium coprophilum TaxID=36646 RepID=UPI00239F48AD|nr:uncharacterized protein N7500_001612 [Penicillium coprophilum]KAJ5173681.1 hypothetical protein N7500_001612 [Penicillium coprophilum]
MQRFGSAATLTNSDETTVDHSDTSVLPRTDEPLALSQSSMRGLKDEVKNKSSSGWNWTE